MINPSLTLVGNVIDMLSVYQIIFTPHISFGNCITIGSLKFIKSKSYYFTYPSLH